MARARFKVLSPVPLRKMERQTRVCCNSPKYWSTVFAMSDPHEGIPRHRRNVGRAIDHQIAIVIQPGTFPRERLRSRPFDLLPVLLELAAVARACNDAQLLLPCCQA